MANDRPTPPSIEEQHRQADEKKEQNEQAQKQQEHLNKPTFDAPKTKTSNLKHLTTGVGYEKTKKEYIEALQTLADQIDESKAPGLKKAINKTIEDLKKPAAFDKFQEMADILQQSDGRSPLADLLTRIFFVFPDLAAAAYKAGYEDAAALRNMLGIDGLSHFTKAYSDALELQHQKEELEKLKTEKAGNIEFKKRPGVDPSTGDNINRDPEDEADNKENTLRIKTKQDEIKTEYEQESEETVTISPSTPSLGSNDSN